MFVIAGLICIAQAAAAASFVSVPVQNTNLSFLLQVSTGEAQLEAAYSRQLYLYADDVQLVEGD